MPRLSASARTTVAAFALTLATAMLASCGSPLQGTWNGTLDVGPIDAWPVVVRLPAQGVTGTLEIVAEGKTTRHPICDGSINGDSFEITFEAGMPRCAATTTEPKSVRRVLVGTVGVEAMWGELFEVVADKREKIGFFRAFRGPAAGS